MFRSLIPDPEKDLKLKLWEIFGSKNGPVNVSIFPVYHKMFSQTVEKWPKHLKIGLFNFWIDSSIFTQKQPMKTKPKSTKKKYDIFQKVKIWTWKLFTTENGNDGYCFYLL